MAATKVGAPGGLFFMPPGANFSSETRHCTIEVKGAINSLVFTPMPGTQLVHPGAPTVLDEYHLTIHDNLMVHVKHTDASTIELGPAVTGGNLDCDALHLVTLAAAPPAAAQPHRGRFQRKYEGGSAIIPISPDVDYHPGLTYLLVDVWAMRIGFNAPGRLPGPQRGVRAAMGNDGNCLRGPLPADWAFRKGPQPNCVFWFRLWFAEIVEFGGRPFIATRTTRRYSKSELLAGSPLAGLSWRIRGHEPHVSFSFGPVQMRLSPSDAQALADRIEQAPRVDVDGVAFVPIAIFDEKYQLQLPAAEATQVPGYLRSAARAALGLPNSSQEATGMHE